MEYITECKITRRINRTFLDYSLHTNYYSEILNDGARILNIKLPSSSYLQVIYQGEVSVLKIEDNKNIEVI